MEASATHPLIKIAAVAVTALSLAGVGVLTGVLPVPGKSVAPPTTSVAEPAPGTVGAAAGTPTTGPVAAVAPAPQSPAATASPSPSRRATPAGGSKPKESTKQHKAAPAQAEGADKAAEAPAKAGTVTAVCRDCGVIESIQEVKKPGEGTGLGAVAGGVLGGILGNQVGGGKGRTAMAVLGAAGGAYAGHQVEKKARSNVEYQITIRFDDGTTQVVTEAAPPAWRTGDRVKVSGGAITAAN
ncbi:MAG TPA: glycine zipper 2TM domain-containing protein [Azospira sp.]|nr:glycine zipper 2TM domain-containing protein [Azospira sp.]